MFATHRFSGAIVVLLLSITSSSAEVMIAIAGPQSGRYSWFGEQQNHGAGLAVQDINANGGVLGEQVRLYRGDDACNPEQGLALAHKLVDLAVKAVIGHGCSGPALAAAPIYEDAGIVAISPGASNPALTETGWNNIFRLFGRDDEQGKLAANYLERNLADTSLAILYDETVYSRELAKIVKAEVRTRGISEKLILGIDVDGFDWSELIDRLKNLNIRTVYFAGRTSDVGLLARHAGDRQYHLNIIGSDPLISEQFWLVAAGAGEGTVFTSAPDAREFDSAQEVVSRLRDSGYEPEGYTLHVYAAVQVWAQAAEFAGTFDAEAVSASLRTETFQTVLGEVGFDDKGDLTGIQTFVWYVWTDGQYVPLAIYGEQQ